MPVPLWKNQQGITLTQIVVVVALVSVSVGGWKIHEHRQQRALQVKRLEAAAAIVRDRVRQTALNDVAWKATKLSNDNSRMACLSDQSSCEGKTGLVNLRDQMNRTAIDSLSPTAGFSIEGYPCLGFSEKGNDDCPLRAEVVWTPVCNGTEGCVAPKTSNLNFTLRFGPGPAFSVPFNPSLYSLTISRETSPVDPKNCAAALATGRNLDGPYSIRPVPGGPAVTVHCDQTRDGGGWTLVANITREVPERLQAEPTVTISSNSFLNLEVIGQLLAASDHQNENNIRVLLPGIDGGFTLAMSSNGATEPVALTALMPEGDCRSVPEQPNYAKKGAPGQLSLTFEGAGIVTFDPVNVPDKGAPGFSICFGTKADGTTCGTGCKSLWRGSASNQRGSIWIR